MPAMRGAVVAFECYLGLGLESREVEVFSERCQWRPTSNSGMEVLVKVIKFSMSARRSRYICGAQSRRR
jgi:hypothetical protein